MFEVCKQEKNNPVVLVVEDEYLVVLVAIELVSELGFKTISAKNADEAIAVLEQRDDIRVVFTDVNMPGSMDGLKLAHVVRGRLPPIDIIVTSAVDLGGAQRLPERGIFLCKPYTFDQVERALHAFNG